MSKLPAKCRFRFRAYNGKKEFLSWQLTVKDNPTNWPFDTAIALGVIEYNEIEFRLGALTSGNIVANNEATRAICESIKRMLDGDEAFNNGWTAKDQYISNLVCSLIMLWD